MFPIYIHTLVEMIFFSFGLFRDLGVLVRVYSAERTNILPQPVRRSPPPKIGFLNEPKKRALTKCKRKKERKKLFGRTCRSIAFLFKMWQRGMDQYRQLFTHIDMPLIESASILQSSIMGDNRWSRRIIGDCREAHSDERKKKKERD